ncbi:zinc finger C2H2-type, ZNF277-like protein, implicated in transcriptional regulation [Schizosaccharomyces osmophilus]|uniref:Zinc finger C2H2-type, ZNF277-like protein, implicated in transcriptional regulation n=1 Tax=Schizosaccharomyces osmophilus TaxID=2545709 RepID=A0AAE9WDH4_9SCHI|nr:zinc finger C2H2-type, ZNF277-like protein, implicated in transcriptional regulation [Schizosaccharomyces osmophilus]WBW74422.1 zinc finger C2H2-type, ZNF277-like protein, implicated in transcriptional regulation [Schizosaccharomyces osmophilus]
MLSCPFSCKSQGYSPTEFIHHLDTPHDIPLAALSSNAFLCAPEVFSHLEANRSFAQNPKELLENSQADALKRVLKVQQKERAAGKEKLFQCLFCGSKHLYTREEWFEHSFDVHELNIGLSDNVVYFDLFLSKMKKELKEVRCLFCSASFPNADILYDHMYRKRHFRLNSKSSKYDEHYIVNYASIIKPFASSSADKFLADENDSETVSDINDEDAEPIIAKCVFCEERLEPEECFRHCKTIHNWDLFSIRKLYHLDIYGTIRVINYARATQSKDIPKKNDPFWTESIWLIPVLEDDALIISLDESAEDT